MWRSEDVSDQKYSHHFTDLLTEMGFQACFLVPGGNTMHLLDSARSRMQCTPFVHEVSATIAVEYFNQIHPTKRAYALVTAGPGITNAITGMAGAYLESRECLVVGGQVKSADLAHGEVRQRGIQEIDGVAIAEPVSKATLQITEPVPDDSVVAAVASGSTDRRGPVFIEFCLDAQAALVAASTPDANGFTTGPDWAAVETAPLVAERIEEALSTAKRPVLLIGGGVLPEVAWSSSSGLVDLGVPLMTTWNGMDRIPDSHPLFAGRPNTWGQRSANVLLAQADLIIALGTRLGMQQTGFNWQQWGPGYVIQVDVDEAELHKGHPRVDASYRADANAVLRLLAEGGAHDFSEWTAFCREVRDLLPMVDPANTQGESFLSPFELVDGLSDTLTARDIVIPASSGSGQFVPMEVFRVTAGQRVLTNKGLASMGYGLAAAIGAALAAPDRRVVLIEGDGSFSQNIQELGTVAVQNLNLKIFLLANDGYASIRTTQRNYFGGEYLGCDGASGLGLPSWSGLADAFGIPWCEVGPAGLADPVVREMLEAPGPALFIVRVDPDQTYFPKVTSRVGKDGVMESNPIHRMSPDIPDELAARVFRYLDGADD